MKSEFLKKLWDVIIVGAGPAGTSATLTLAKAGINTLILEKKKVVGVPNHCGEGISHYVLDFLGADDKRGWIVKKMKGTKIFFPNQKFLYYPEKSYCINRTLFDQELAENATKKGAKLLLNQKVIGITKDNGIWQVTTKNGQIYKCKYIIAADGTLSTVRRLFGVRENIIMAIQYKFNPMKRFEDEYLGFYHNEKYHPCYAWIFNRGIETSIGIGGAGNLREKLEWFLKSLNIDTTKKISVQCGGVPNPIRSMRIALPGILFAGDAGGFTFPLTGGGIIGALISGRAAGEAIRDALIERQPEILSTYPKRVKLHPSRSRVALFYSRKFFSLDNNSLNAIGEVIDQRIFSEIPIINALHCIIKNYNWQSVNGLLIGFAAQQILNYFKKYVF